MQNSKQISLTQGKFTTVDEEDFEYLSQWNWYAKPSGKRNCYAHAYNGGNRMYMHRLLLNPPKGMYIDHINGNGLDNRKTNLRIVTLSQNQGNRRLTSTSVSGYKGVHRNREKWQAVIWHKN